MTVTPSTRYTRSPTTSKAKGSVLCLRKHLNVSFTPPLKGTNFVTKHKPTSQELSTSYPQPIDVSWITRQFLSTATATYPQNLWITSAVCGKQYMKDRIWTGHMTTWRCSLWINLWIRGVKSVDKPVDSFVDNLSLWISQELSTFCPQEFTSYPRFCPQARRDLQRLR